MPTFSPSFVVNTTATVNNGTTVNPNDSLPHNCHTIMLYNPDPTLNVLFKVGIANAGSPIATADGGVVPPNSSLTIAMGVLTKRPRADNKLVYSLESTAPVGNKTLFITYVCGNRL